MTFQQCSDTDTAGGSLGAYYPYPILKPQGKTLLLVPTGLFCHITRKSEAHIGTKKDQPIKTALIGPISE